MALEELNEKLHGRDVHLHRGGNFTPYDPEHPVATAEAVEEFHETEKWGAKESITNPDLLLVGSQKKRRYLIAVGVSVAVLLLLIGGVIFKMRSSLFSEDKVSLSVAGPKNVASAEPVSFTVAYSNGNMTDMKDAVLIVTHPDTFRLEKSNEMKLSGHSVEVPLGDITAKAKGEKIFTGKFYGSKGELGHFGATIRYTPNGFKSSFEKSAERYEVTIASSPLSLEVSAPQELVTGQEIDYVVEYRNQSDSSFSNLRLRMEYSEGFQFLNADPGTSEGENIWNIGTLPAGGSGKILVHGILSGARDEFKNVRAEIGLPQGDGTFLTYSDGERQTKMIASPLSITQTVNGVTSITVNPGDTLDYEIQYRNDGNVGLRDTVVTVEIDPAYLDMKGLVLTNGSYDEKKKVITWKASDVPGLARLEPGAEGKFSFRVPVQKTITLASGASKNISIRSVAKIDSPDVPAIAGSNKIIGSNILLVKLGALVSINMEGLYSDSPIENSGPTPPIVGQETTYTIRLSLNNSSNDITQSRLVLAFPSGIVYKKKSTPESETVSFNERTNEFTWEIGTLSPDNSRTLSLQIGLTPSSSQVGKTPLLLNKATFSGKDTFTSQTLKIEKKGESLSNSAIVGNVRSQ